MPSPWRVSFRVLILLLATGLVAPGAACMKKSRSKSTAKFVTLVQDDSAAGGAQDDRGEDIVLDASGRILVAGESWNGFNFDMVIWRFESDGTPDVSFGTGGIVIDDGAAGGFLDDYGYGIALDSNGKILVTGESDNLNDFDMVLWRYNPNGTLDTSFNLQGWVVHDGAAGGTFMDDAGVRVAVDATDRILVTGESRAIFGDFDMIIWAYNPDGSPDLLFGTNGIVAHDNAAGGGDDDFGMDIALDPAGRIVVTGRSTNPFLDLDMVVWRFNPDGTSDTTFGFGVSGLFWHDGAAGGFSDDGGLGVDIDSLGRIVVAGWSLNVFFDPDAVVWRLDPDGLEDLAFNGQGWVQHDDAAGGLGFDVATDVAVAGSSTIVAIGFSQNGFGDPDLAIWQYGETGGLARLIVQDSGAGGAGPDEGLAVTEGPAGQFFMTGDSLNAFGDADMMIWCFQ